MVLKTSEEFLEVADALGTAGWGAKGIIVVVEHVQGVFISGPFVGCEEIAEGRHPNISIFIRTDTLHRICVVVRERETRWRKLLKSGSCLVEIERYISVDV